jgi:hypothetical protein
VTVDGIFNINKLILNLQLYFEKAFFANACKKTGDPDAEKKYRQQMEELEPQMGQFSAEKEQILKIFPDL